MDNHQVIYNKKTDIHCGCRSFFSHYTNNKSFTQFAFEHGKVEVELESHYIHVGASRW